MHQRKISEEVALLNQSKEFFVCTRALGEVLGVKLVSVIGVVLMESLDLDALNRPN